VDLYNRLYRERILFLGQQIDDEIANQMVGVMLYLDSEEQNKPISMYINCPGGIVSAGLAIYDTMQYLRPQVQTICIGQAASMGAILLAAGAPGKRYALPHCRIMIHQLMGGFSGQAEDIDIQAREIVRLTGTLNVILAEHTGKDPEQIEQDTQRDYYLSGEEAKTYGLVDHVMTRREESPASSNS
jgi:ATP-dependent Clp protease protease subunit